MGIKFRCQGCDKKLHVKAFLAGKRGICPQCGAKVRIPLASETGSAKPEGPKEQSEKQSEKRPDEPSKSRKRSAKESAAVIEPSESAVQSASPNEPTANPSPSGIDPITESPESVWYVRPPTGGQFGPADGDIMHRWLDEGRVSGDSLVWREGWSDWKPASKVFSVLQQQTPETPTEPTIAPPEEQSSAPIVLSDSTPIARHARTRLPASSNTRNVALLVGLSVVCVGLLIALLVVLQN